MNFDSLYKIAFHTTRDEEKSKDLAQELYLKMVENSDSFGRAYNEGKHIGWLYRVARQIHHLEHRYDVKRKEAEEIFEILDREILDPHELLMRAKAILDEIDYLWLTTYIDYDQNYSEIARQFNITRQQASTNIRRIIKLLE